MADRTPLIQILRKPPQASAASEPRPGTPQWPAGAEPWRQSSAGRAAGEQCEFCGAAIAAEHGHLADLPRRALLCVCRACYLLFTHDGAGGARFRAVPTRYVMLPEFAAARESWEALDLPIGLAFFFRNSATGRTTAFYPSPAGATESELPLGSWDALARAVPALGTLAADVEALLVRRDQDRMDALIVPIDACYELVGVIRIAWRGFHGGDELHRHVDSFFARARERATETGV